MLNLRQNKSLKYIARPEHYPLFFSETLQTTVSTISQALGDKNKVWVFPDATLKKNKIPTGMAFLAAENDAILMPFLLRDPGCGYLIFKFEWLGSNAAIWHHALGKILNDLLCQKIPELQKITFKPDKNTMQEIIARGLNALNATPKELNCFLHTQFAVIPEQVNLTDVEIERLQQDFADLTNTVEIRTLSNVRKSIELESLNLKNNDHVGFIHSGSHVFPDILGERFVHRTLEFSDNHHLFPIEQMKDGIFGVPFNSPLGKEYHQWLLAAQNYVIASRYCLFQAIKKVLETLFPCRLTLIKDNLHAGVFRKEYRGNTLLFSARGVQDISLTQDNSINLLAGHRETRAALVTRSHGAAPYYHLCAHGTGLNTTSLQHNDLPFSSIEKELFMKHAQNAFYNTTPRLEECLPLTYNFKTSLEYFEKIGLVYPLAMLEPLINIQSNYYVPTKKLSQDVEYC